MKPTFGTLVYLAQRRVHEEATEIGREVTAEEEIALIDEHKDQSDSERCRVCTASD